VFNSTAGREHTEMGYRPRRTEVIPNGFDLRSSARSPVAGRFAPKSVTADVRRRHDRPFASYEGSVDLPAAAAPSDGRSVVMAGLNHDWQNKALVAEIDQYGLRDRITPRHATGHRARHGRPGLSGVTRRPLKVSNVTAKRWRAACPVSRQMRRFTAIVGDTGTILPIRDVVALSPQYRN
jgi:hypothetical protein